MIGGPLGVAAEGYQYMGPTFGPPVGGFTPAPHMVSFPPAAAAAGAAFAGAGPSQVPAQQLQQAGGGVAYPAPGAAAAAAAGAGFGGGAPTQQQQLQQAPPGSLAPLAVVVPSAAALAELSLPPPLKLTASEMRRAFRWCYTCQIYRPPRCVPAECERKFPQRWRHNRCGNENDAGVV